MVVILADGAYRVAKRSHPWALDQHGVSAPAALGAYGAARAGAAHAQPGQDWKLRLDPAEWPVRAGDRVTDGARTWTVTGTPTRIAHPADGAVDYVSAFAALDPPQVP